MKQNLRKGRKVNINRHDLKPRKDREYADIVLFGDTHLGHPNFLREKAQDLLNYCLRTRTYMVCMGDMIESGITGSVGDSIYTQTLNPQAQMEEMIDMLMPLAKAGLLLGLHAGNHEMRIFKTSGINVAKNMAGWLGVPFLHSACWHLFRVNGHNYTMYSLHGASGSKFIYTKIKAATDISHYFGADIIAHAHVHDRASVAIERQEIDMRNKQVAYRKQYILLTGHYLGYDLSYAQDKGMPPSKVGSPRIRLYANDWDIHIRE